jgi:hypothetical protein
MSLARVLAFVFVIANCLATVSTIAAAEQSYEGTVYDLDFIVSADWVQVLLLPKGQSQNVVAVTGDQRAVAILAAAMGAGSAVTITVETGPPNKILRVKWNRPTR